MAGNPGRRPLLSTSGCRLNPSETPQFLLGAQDALSEDFGDAPAGIQRGRGQNNTY